MFIQPSRLFWALLGNDARNDHWSENPRRNLFTLWMLSPVLSKSLTSKPQMFRQKEKCHYGLLFSPEGPLLMSVTSLHVLDLEDDLSDDDLCDLDPGLCWPQLSPRIHQTTLSENNCKDVRVTFKRQSLFAFCSGNFFDINVVDRFNKVSAFSLKCQ